MRSSLLPGSSSGPTPLHLGEVIPASACADLAGWTGILPLNLRPFLYRATARGTATPTPSLKPLQSLVLGRRRSAGYASFSFLALGPRPLASRQGWVSAGFGTQFLAYGSEDKQN